ncbi:hypothetical protein BM1_01427 [Bipolaris maydis]|nr:hypothetical protein BM1_01427 [Bipolaris maydis]
MFSRIFAPFAMIISSIYPLVSCGLATSFDIMSRTPASGIDVEALVPKLSPRAGIYLPDTDDFISYTTRWSNLEAPTPSVVIAPGTENDVQHIVDYPGTGKMDYGIEIYMPQLDSIAISKDGKSVTVGGGINSKKLIDTLWTAGKQTVTGCCECVSFLGPALGGGHGWLQGRHGLITDQFESMNIVLANGDFKSIDSRSDLWWGMQGAGQNFGIVTSVTTKIYDIEHSNWAIETIIFSGDKVEEVYGAANKHILRGGNQSVEIQNWSYWQNDATLDSERPVIIMYIIQEGVTFVESKYTAPFHDIGPLTITPQSGSYLDLAKWTSIALDSPPYQDFGFNNPRFPIYTSTYNITAQRKAYDLYVSAISGADNPYYNSIFMFEDYPSDSVRHRDNSASAFGFRNDYLLSAPLIIYNFTGQAQDDTVKQLGTQLRNIIWEGTGRKELHTYVNYAYGDEGSPSWYGHEEWR